MRISRRNFLAASVKAGCTFACLPLLQNDRNCIGKVGPTANRLPGKVIEVSSSNAASEKVINPVTIKKLLNKGLCELTGTSDPRDAIGDFFNPKDVVAIKVNPLNNMCPTHPEIVHEVIFLLQQIGIKPGNIIIWDRFENYYGLTQSGYKIQRDPGKVQCFATDTPGIGPDPEVYYENALPFFEGDGYSGTEKIYNPAWSSYSRIITQMATKIINMPVLKHHGLSGVSLCLKNLAFGSVNNTIRLHANNCNPYIAEIYSHPVIRDKTVLSIVDSIFGWYADSPNYKGPDPIWYAGSILIGTDPVSLDTTGEKIIVQKRREQNIGEEEDIKISTHIQAAANLGLGIKDKIEHRVFII